MNLDRFGMKAISQRTNKWVFGNYIESFKDCFGFLWRYSRREVYHTACVYPETICQCTGLRDTKGNLIYENDYLHVKGMYKGEPVECEKALVKYDEAMLTWLVRMDDHSEYLKNIVRQGVGAWECVVVGNKFDKEKQGE